MELESLQDYAAHRLGSLVSYIERVPGSAIVIRYIRSSYQNDPVRSAIELFLFLFAVRYLLAPSYSVQKQKGYVEFTDNVRSRALTSCGLS